MISGCAYRRNIAYWQATLDAAVEDYDASVVQVLGGGGATGVAIAGGGVAASSGNTGVAGSYVAIRQAQEQIALAQANVELQRGVLKIVQARLDAGRTSELDVDQAQATLSQTEAEIPAFEITLREAENELCILLGIPPADLQARLGVRPIPVAPADVVVGIPAELLRRRPDVRSAERNAAAWAEQVGIAQADFYPHIAINGILDYQARNFSDLYRPSSFNGSIGPGFTWNVLNYGRILNNVRYQDAIFQQYLLNYRQVVLNANQDAENGLITFLKAQQRAKVLRESVLAAEKAVNIVVNQYKVGTVDFNRVATIEQNLVLEQDLLAQARGQIATGLIQVYRVLGGGWQIRLENDETAASSSPRPAQGSSNLPPIMPALDPLGEKGVVMPEGLPKPMAPDVALPPPPAPPAIMPAAPAAVKPPAAPVAEKPAVPEQLALPAAKLPAAPADTPAAPAAPEQPAPPAAKPPAAPVDTPAAPAAEKPAAPLPLPAADKGASSLRKPLPRLESPGVAMENPMLLR